MTVRETPRSALARRMRASTDRGHACAHCGTDVKECQATFVLTDDWCCTMCRVDGPRALHTVAPA